MADATDATSGSVPDIGYAAALRELEAILAELEDDTLDVDLLADRVARAAELIDVCRTRIDGARMQVERIVAALDGDPADQWPPDLGPG